MQYLIWVLLIVFCSVPALVAFYLSKKNDSYPDKGGDQA